MTSTETTAPHCLNHFDAFEGLQHCTRCGRVFCGDCLVTLQGQPFCAACKTEQALDVQSGVDPMQAQYATILRRFCAQFIDGIVVGIPFQVLGGLAQAAAILFKSIWLQMAISGSMVILIFVAMIAYEALMIRRNGQTVGKLALKIKVVRADGGPVSNRDAWIRPIVRLFAGSLCGADYIAALFNPERMCIHDMAAKTRVINVP